MKWFFEEEDFPEAEPKERAEGGQGGDHLRSKPPWRTKRTMQKQAAKPTWTFSKSADYLKEWSLTDQSILWCPGPRRDAKLTTESTQTHSRGEKIDTMRTPPSDIARAGEDLTQSTPTTRDICHCGSRHRHTHAVTCHHTKGRERTSHEDLFET